MNCSRDYYHSSRFNQQYEKLTPTLMLFYNIIRRRIKQEIICGEELNTELISKRGYTRRR